MSKRILRMFALFLGSCLIFNPALATIGFSLQPFSPLTQPSSQIQSTFQEQTLSERVLSSTNLGRFLFRGRIRTTLGRLISGYIRPRNHQRLTELRAGKTRLSTALVMAAGALLSAGSFYYYLKIWKPPQESWRPSMFSSSDKGHLRLIHQTRDELLMDLSFYSLADDDLTSSGRDTSNLYRRQIRNILRAKEGREAAAIILADDRVAPETKKLLEQSLKELGIVPLSLPIWEYLVGEQRAQDSSFVTKWVPLLELWAIPCISISLAPWLAWWAIPFASLIAALLHGWHIRNAETISPTRKAVRAQLTEILQSRTFAERARSKQFLEFIVTQSLEGKAEKLGEDLIAQEVFRKPDFNAREESIVRTEAGRLRVALRHYYVSEGQADAIFIDLPNRTYIPSFAMRTPLSEKSANRWTQTVEQFVARTLGSFIINTPATLLFLIGTHKPVYLDLLLHGPMVAHLISAAVFTASLLIAYLLHRAWNVWVLPQYQLNFAPKLYEMRVFAAA